MVSSLVPYQAYNNFHQWWVVLVWPPGVTLLPKMGTKSPLKWWKWVLIRATKSCEKWWNWVPVFADISSHGAITMPSPSQNWLKHLCLVPYQAYNSFQQWWMILVWPPGVTLLPKMGTKACEDEENEHWSRPLLVAMEQSPCPHPHKID